MSPLGPPWKPPAGDVPDQPHPLDADEIAKIKECLGAGSIVWHWSYVARLVATVEAQATDIEALRAKLTEAPCVVDEHEALATQLADAHNVIRRMLDGYQLVVDVWVPRHDGHITPLSPGEVDAIRQARASTEETTP